MEVVFNNLQDNLVYRSNIFNYDKPFLTSLLSRDVKLNFSEYLSVQGKQSKDVAQVINYLKAKSKTQVDSMTYACQKEIGTLSEEENEEFNQSKKQDSRDAIKTLRLLFNLFMYSLEKAEEKAKQIEGSLIQPGEVNADNLITCLLFFDGISMANTDIVRLIDLNAFNTGKSLAELVFRILNNRSIDFHIQEIASHILSLALMSLEGSNNEAAEEQSKNSKNLMKWTYEISVQKQRDSCLTSNFSLLLTIDDNIDYFLSEFNEECPCMRKLFELMVEPETNTNIIYESLFCMWNISNNRKYIKIFENRENKYIEKIVQVIRTNKIDKVARIGLMTLKNLLENQRCVEILFDIKFKNTVSILKSNKWNDEIIRKDLDYCNEFLEKNYKAMK